MSYYENNYDLWKRAHTHEYLGNVRMEDGDKLISHTFSGVTEEEIPLPSVNHYHKLVNRTDFHEDHFHIMCTKTGPGMCVGDGRHVHFVKDFTDAEQDHKHEFIFSTSTDNPAVN